MKKEIQLSDPKANTSKFGLWFKRIGIAGFLFFFIKGLIWIAVLYGGAELFR